MLSVKVHPLFYEGVHTFTRFPDLYLWWSEKKITTCLYWIQSNADNSTRASSYTHMLASTSKYKHCHGVSWMHHWSSACTYRIPPPLSPSPPPPLLLSLTHIIYWEKASRLNNYCSDVKLIHASILYHSRKTLIIPVISPPMHPIPTPPFLRNAST